MFIHRFLDGVTYIPDVENKHKQVECSPKELSYEVYFCWTGLFLYNDISNILSSQIDTVEIICSFSIFKESPFKIYINFWIVNISKGCVFLVKMIFSMLNETVWNMFINLKRQIYVCV